MMNRGGVRLGVGTHECPKAGSISYEHLPRIESAWTDVLPVGLPSWETSALVCLCVTSFLSAWMFGDPHIVTLDNANFTFNGLGDFLMIRARDGNSSFLLQGRTAQTDSALATNFIAFAAEYNSLGLDPITVSEGHPGCPCTKPQPLRDLQLDTEAQEEEEDQVRKGVEGRVQPASGNICELSDSRIRILAPPLSSCLALKQLLSVQCPGFFIALLHRAAVRFR